MGKAFHFNIPQLSQRYGERPPIRFVRQHDVDEFLGTMTYNELLGFLPDDPGQDSYIFAVREANTFRMICEDPSVFLDPGEAWYDTQSSTIGGDLGGGCYEGSMDIGEHTTNRNDATSCTDWDLNYKANHTMTATANWASMKTNYSEADLEKMRPWLAWIPIENIRKTLENTTQIAKAVSNYPMIRHLASRFRLLNKFRLREIVSTDTIFSSVQAIGGARCAQVFYGLTSHHMDVFGMDSKGQFSEVYKEFIRDQGIPSGLHRDNAPEQKSHVVTQLNRDYGIKESFAEAGYPNQNPVESKAIKWLKRAGERLLNHTGAPDYVWLWAYQYLALVNNWTADRTLRWKCPHTKRFGVTPDISALLSFHFYEPIYYLDIEEPTPLSREKAGYWLGVAHNVGDALTYHILTDESQQVIQRSVVRSRRGEHGINRRVTFNPNLDPAVTLDENNQNVGQGPMTMDNKEIPLERWHRRRRRMRRDRGGRVRRQQVEAIELKEENDIIVENDGTVEEGEFDPIDEYGPLIDGVEDTSDDPGGQTETQELIADHDQPQDTEEGLYPVTNTGQAQNAGEEGDQTVRKSNRKSKPPSRFIQAVMIGLQMGKFLHTDPMWNVLKPLQDLPSTHGIVLEQDMTASSTLLRHGINKMRELYVADSFADDWEPDAEVEKILKHKHTNYVRRLPGKHTYHANVPPVTTAGVRVLAKFFSGAQRWVPMEAARGDNPIPLIEYSMKNDLWKKSDRWGWTKEFGIEETEDLRRAFIAKFENTPKYKFGVQIPTSIPHALRLDKLNGNSLWQEAIKKEMDQLAEYNTFRVPTEQDDLGTYQQIPYHMVFDCKFDGRRKGRLVAGGNHAVVTSEQVYSGVVGIETVRTILALSSMDSELEVMAADVSNAFLYGKNKEKTMIKAGPEFGDLEGKLLLVEGGWYGHKTAAATFHTHLSSKLRAMGFTPTKADLDLWIKKGVDGRYEYIATYVDDIIIISRKPMEVIDQFKETYSLKGVGTPEYYLGGNFLKMDDPVLMAMGIKTALSARTYIDNSIEKFERMFGGPIQESKFPMKEGLHPESDTSQPLSDEMATRYRAVIGSLNWVVILGRFDVMYATNTLARFSMIPRTGHLEATIRILGYLKKYRDHRILLNPNPIDLRSAEEKYTEYDGWKELYPEACEEIPDGLPDPIPNMKVQITVMVDADHAHCEVTRRSVTGILVFVNSTPIRWCSKMQKTVETSTYGSELVAARIATDIALELRYNIRMMGFGLDGPVNLFGDNQSVILNTTIPSSQLKKKIHACAYHRIREMISCKAIRFIHCQSIYNAADVLTKPLGGIMHRALVEPILCGDGVPSLFKRETTER